MICSKCQKEIYNKHSMYACDVMYRCECNDKLDFVQVRKSDLERWSQVISNFNVHPDIQAIEEEINENLLKGGK